LSSKKHKILSANIVAAAWSRALVYPLSLLRFFYKIEYYNNISLLVEVLQNLIHVDINQSLGEFVLKTDKRMHMIGYTFYHPHILQTRRKENSSSALSTNSKRNQSAAEKTQADFVFFSPHK